MQLALHLPPMAEAQARGQLGMERAADRAEREAPGWTEQAVEALRMFARAQSEDFNVEAARLAVEGFVPKPVDKRAWGAVTQLAIRRGYIERVPGQFLPAASSHACPKAAYRCGRGAA